MKYFRNQNRYIYFLFFIAIIPLLTLSFLQTEDAYWYLTYPQYEIFKLTGFIAMENVPGHAAYVLILNYFSNIPIETLQFLPINGLLIIFIGFIIVRKISNSNFIGILFSVYLGFNFTNFTHGYSLATNGLGIILFYSFMYIIYSLYNNINNEEEKNHTKYVIIALLIVTTLNFIYYSIELWVISFILIFGIILNINNLIKDRKIITFNSFFIACLVLFIFFSNIIYKGFISRIHTFDTLSFSLNWISIKIFGNKPKIDFEYVKINILHDFITIILVLFLIGTAALLLIIFILKHSSNHQNQYKNKIWVYFSLSLIGISIFETLIYILRGALNLRSVFFIFPILILLLLKVLLSHNYDRDKGIKIFSVFFIIIIFLSSLLFFISYSNDLFSSSSNYEKVQNSALWYREYTIPNSVALADLNTIYKMKMKTIYSQYLISFTFYNSLLYQKLIDRDFDHLYQYLIIDYGKLDKVLISTTPQMDWKSFEPLIFHYETIKGNNHLNKIYNDMNIEIFVNM